jgi:putative nucleotidyltransferase with HDIG domain
MQLTLQDAISIHNKETMQRSPSDYTNLLIYCEKLGETLASLLGLRDPHLLAHSLRVANFSANLARGLGCSPEQVDLVRRGGLLHDLGKLGIPQAILSHPGVLTREQYELVKLHPVLGVALLQESPEYGALMPIVRHHHEFFNGQGYPDRLAGDEIEIEARIVAVADAVDVMASNRPYCRAFTAPQIIEELERCSGTQFDPMVVEAAIPLLLVRKHENSHYSGHLPKPIMGVEQSRFMECGNE